MLIMATRDVCEGTLIIVSYNCINTRCGNHNCLQIFVLLSLFFAPVLLSTQICGANYKFVEVSRFVSLGILLQLVRCIWWGCHWVWHNIVTLTTAWPRDLKRHDNLAECLHNFLDAVTAQSTDLQLMSGDLDLTLEYHFTRCLQKRRFVEFRNLWVGDGPARNCTSWHRSPQGVSRWQTIRSEPIRGRARSPTNWLCWRSCLPWTECCGVGPSLPLNPPPCIYRNTPHAFYFHSRVLLLHCHYY